MVKERVTLIEAHNPLSALIAEHTRVVDAQGEPQEFDGLWSSSLTDSTARGLPDTELLDVLARIQNIYDIRHVTSKPIVFDGDTGGHCEHFATNVKRMERAGISAVVIEDKVGIKRNSLLGTDVFQLLSSPDDFCRKIEVGKAAQLHPKFMVIARIEGLILGLGMAEALCRADAYVAAGADGIMIHSRQSSPSEVVEFARNFRIRHPDVPLVCVPSSYHSIHARDLQKAGFNIVIYANHMLRAAYKSMRTVAEGILVNGRSTEVEDHCMTLPEILDLVPN